MGREVGQADSERKWNMGSFNFHSSYFSLSPHTQYETKKVSIIMEGDKCCVTVIEINSVISKNTYPVPVSGNAFHPLPIL